MSLVKSGHLCYIHYPHHHMLCPFFTISKSIYIYILSTKTDKLASFNLLLEQENRQELQNLLFTIFVIVYIHIYTYKNKQADQMHITPAAILNK